MELKEFINKVVNDILGAVSQINRDSEREVMLVGSDANRTIEFDIAVSAEEKIEGKIGGGVKVWSFAEGNLAKNTEAASSTVTRLRFGVHVGHKTKEENRQQNELRKAQFNKTNDFRMY